MIFCVFISNSHSLMKIKHSEPKFGGRVWIISRYIINFFLSPQKVEKSGGYVRYTILRRDGGQSVSYFMH